MEINQQFLTKYIYHLFSLLLIVGFFFTAAADAQAQTPSFVRTQITSISGNTAQCTGGVTIELDDVDISSQVGEPTVNDLTAGTWVTMEEGQYLAVQSSATNTVFRAQKLYVERLQDLLIVGKIEKVDSNRNSITVLGKEIFFDGDTKLLKKKKKKTKAITINELAPGMVVSIEALLLENGVTARKLVQGFGGFGPTPAVSGFVTNYTNGIAEVAGGFLIDVNSFGLSGRQLEVGSRGAFLIRDDTASPYKINGIGVSFPFIALTGNLEAVDAANRTVTISKRQFVIDDDTEFFGVIDFTDFEVGKRADVSFREVNGRLVATVFGQ